MLINKTVELPGGSVRFEGELDATELDYVLSVGLSLLLMKGAMPYVIEEDSEIAPNTTDTIQ